MGKISFRVITDQSGLENIHEAWNYLLKKSTSDTVFLTWEWMYTWWECFGEGKNLYVIVAEDDCKIVGIAPLHISQSRFFGLQSLRHLEFLGTTGVITEYQDFIIEPGRERELISMFIEFLFTDSMQWDAFNLVSLKQDSVTIQVISEYCKDKSLQSWDYASRISPYIGLPGSIDEYMKSLSNKSRWKFRDYRKKLENGRVVELYETKEKSLVAEDFETIMSLHQKRWENKGGPGSFAQARDSFIRFHSTIVQRFFDNGWLYLLMLIVDDRPVAGHYSFFYHDIVYCHTVGFDPEWTQSNVGSVLQLLAIEDSIIKGAKVFDFLCGTEQYKYYWTKKECVSVDKVIWRSSRIAHRVDVERKLRKIGKELFPKTLVDKIYYRFVNRD
jgi:CelD/BcsL family acetyltransferase involved in cellulose biosynthesis